MEHHLAALPQHDYSEHFERLHKATQNLSEENKDHLFHLLLSDPLLADVPPAATNAHVEALIAHELGRAFTIFVAKHTGEKISLVVTKESTIRDVKDQLKAVISHDVEKKGTIGARKISWKYVWSHNCLMFGKTRLLDESAQLSNLGIEDGACLHFSDYRPPDPRGRW